MGMNVKSLDNIVKDTINAVENGKKQIVDILDNARHEYVEVKKSLDRLKIETSEVIIKVDELERKERLTRIRLVEVSREFIIYTEADIKVAYDEARYAQVELAIMKERELSLRTIRNNLELRTKNLKETVEKAEKLTSQVGVVLDFMSHEMGGVLTQIEDMQKRQKYGAKILKAQEEERRRVARDIHDGPAQNMAHLILKSEVCERLIDSDRDRAKRELKELRDNVRDCLNEMRRIIFDLRPMVLDDLGLIPTVNKILDNLMLRSNIVGELCILGNERNLDIYTKVGVFRVIQEALNNAEKHSKAKSVKVIIEFNVQTLKVVIEDDGIGFNPETSIGNESFGLVGIKERVAHLGGKLDIKSKLKSGTRIKVEVPI